MSIVDVERLEGWRNWKESNKEFLASKDGLSFLSSGWLSDRYLTRSDVSEKLRKVYLCLDKIGVRDVPEAEEQEAPQVDIVNGNWCKCHSVCPACASRVQSRRRNIYEKPVREAISNHNHIYMITFTVKDGARLSERLDHLRASFRRWYRLGQKRGSVRSNGESAKIGAALVGFESTKTNAGLWHVHAHALVFASERIDYEVYDQRLRSQAVARVRGKRVADADLAAIANSWRWLDGEPVPVSKLSGEWLDVTGDSVNIDVRPIRGEWCAVRESVFEVLKYAIKIPMSGGFDKADYVEIVSSTYGRRLFSALRGFRGLAGQDEDYNDKTRTPDYTLVWSYAAKEYRGIWRKPKELSKDALKVVGVLVGQWRRERRARITAGGCGLAAALDRLKIEYRVIIKNIWRAADRSAFVAACRGVILPSPALPVWVQTSLFT